MRLGLYVPRRSSFVFMGPIAQAAMKMGHQVSFVRDPMQEKDGDGWWNADLPWNGDWSFWSGSVVDRPELFCGDWLIAPSPVPYPRQGQRCALEAWFDQMAVGWPQDADHHHSTIRDGCPAFDGLADVPYAEQDALVWFLPKTRVPGLQRITRHAIVLILNRALRACADRHDLQYIIRTRAKSQAPRPVQMLANAVISATDIYPWTSLRLLVGAQLAVCHQSAAGFEAAAAGVRALSVRLPQRHLERLGHWSLMNARRGSPYAWPGVIEALDLLPAVRWLRQWKPRPIDEKARAAYFNTWFGGRVLGASVELIQRLEDQC